MPTNHADENAIAISNDLINDRRLSPAAFRLACRMCSQQQRMKGWVVPDPADIPRIGYESLGLMKGHFEELVDAGYLVPEGDGYVIKPDLWKWPSEVEDAPTDPLRWHRGSIKCA